MRVRIQILGMANFTSNITANGNAVTWFDTEDSAPWWFSPVPMDPDGNGYTAINITATLGNDTTSTTGYAYSPGDPSSPIMNDDLRGTTSDDGTANTYNYDAEGRLISIVPYDFESALNIPQREIVFKYDDRGRRTERLIYYADNGDGYPPEWNGTPVLTYNMTYDGWNLVTETGNEIAACYRVFVWGLDKGGAVDDPTPVWGPDAAAQSAAAGAGGAGGVGGLIMGALYADNFYDAESGVCYGYDANAM